MRLFDMTPVPGLQRERGAVLIVSLLFLVILTMLGITAMSSTTFEERMAGNARDAALAHQAAEAATREARDEVLCLSKKQKRDTHLTVFAPQATADKPAGECMSDSNRRGLCRATFHDSDTKTIPPAIPANVDWSGNTTVEYGTFSGAPPLEKLSNQPRYIIELLCLQLEGYTGTGPAETCRIFRFTALGWGKNPNTRVTVQETYIAEKERPPCI